MKNLTTAALLLALCCAPSIVQAEVAGASPPAVSGLPSGRPTESAPLTVIPDEARDYAAREAASPALSEFEGGGVAIYLGGGAVTVILVVLLIVIIL